MIEHVFLYFVIAAAAVVGVILLGILVIYVISLIGSRRHD